MKPLRTFRRALSLGPSPARWDEHEGMYRKSVLIVQVYYIVMLYLLYERARGFSALGGSVDSLELMWPVLWLEWTGLELGGKIIAHLCLAAGLLGALLWRLFAVRALVSVTFLMTMAFYNSSGMLHHSQHEWFWLSVCFLFLPNGKTNEIASSRAGRMSFLMAFSAAPLLILTFYTMSGLYKAFFATAALVMGNVGGFHPEAMANTLAWRAMSTGSLPMWAEPVINYPLIGWLPYLSLYFIEIVAIAVLFRPVLHRLWGVLLIVFHFGTLLFMDITFPLHVLINGLLFVMSPFAPRSTDWQTVLVAVPIVGPVLSRLGLKRRISPQGAGGLAAAE